MSIDMANLLQTYGYWAVAAGTFVEGETVLLTASAAASRGYLWMPAVIAIATLSGFLGDQIFFYLGRRYGRRLLVRFPSLQPRAARVGTLLERHHVLLILLVRFMYGLRIAGPVAIGMSGVQWMRFLTLNLIGAVIWATIIGSVGYGLGRGLSRLAYVAGGLDADELWLLAAVLLVTIVWWIIVRSKHFMHTRRQRDRTSGESK